MKIEDLKPGKMYTFRLERLPVPFPAFEHCRYRDMFIDVAKILIAEKSGK